MKDCVLKIENYKIFRKKYLKGAHAQNDLLIQIPTLSIERGNIIFILGNNGSGKSTILKSLFSFDLEGKNYISIAESSKATLYSARGFELNLMSRTHCLAKMHQAISYLGQDDIFNSLDNVIEAIARHAQAALLESQKDIDKVKFTAKQDFIKQRSQTLALQYLKELYMYEKRYYESSETVKDKIALKILKKKPAHSCSFGQQKMISILANFLKSEVMESDLIVMDEPLNHLDAKNKIEVVKLLSQYIVARQQKNNPVTLIMISHCLVFPFINNGKCHQYQIIDNELIPVPEDKKIFINCLAFHDKPDDDFYKHGRISDEG